MSKNIQKIKKGSYTLICEMWSDGRDRITKSDGVELDNTSDLFDELVKLEAELREVKQELGLTRILLENRKTLLNSCEIALDRAQFPLG